MRGNVVVVLAVLMGWAAAHAESGVLEMKAVRSKGQFADLALALEKATLYDTSVCLDAQVGLHRVFCDSGVVFYQRPAADASGRVFVREDGETADTVWIMPIRMSFRGVNSSPLVFLMDEPGERPRLVVMWREEHEDWTEVWVRFQSPGDLPMRWSVPLSLAQPRY